MRGVYLAFLLLVTTCVVMIEAVEPSHGASPPPTAKYAKFEHGPKPHTAKYANFEQGPKPPPAKYAKFEHAPKTAKFAMAKQPPPGEDLANMEEGDGTVGCSYEWSTARYFCWTYGCNYYTPSDWCWLPVYCGDDSSICNDYKYHVQQLPCWGSCS